MFVSQWFYGYFRDDSRFFFFNFLRFYCPLEPSLIQKYVRTKTKTRFSLGSGNEECVKEKKAWFPVWLCIQVNHLSWEALSPDLRYYAIWKDEIRDNPFISFCFDLWPNIVGDCRIDSLDESIQKCRRQ